MIGYQPKPHYHYRKRAWGIELLLVISAVISISFVSLLLFFH